VKVSHLINTVGDSARGDLREAQRITLESIYQARQVTNPEIEVEVRAARFADEPLPADWLVDAVQLTRSVIDVVPFPCERRLPLLADILTGVPSDSDLVVFTNIDIAVQPHFYELLVDLHARGYDAFTINRRTVLPRNGSSDGLAWFTTQPGMAHWGTDCFVFVPSIAPQIDVGQVCLGVGAMAKALLFNLRLLVHRFRVFADLHATFHVGDDRIWRSSAFSDLTRHNDREVCDVVRRLSERFDSHTVAQLPTVRRFLPGRSDKLAARSPHRGPGRFRDSSVVNVQGKRQLVVTVSPGSTATDSIARLLEQGRRTVAHHECEPTMAGPWLRRVIDDGPEASFEERRVKAAALRWQMSRLPDRGYLVDSNHMFVKTYADVVLDEFNLGELIVLDLRRDVASLAKSMMERGWFSPAAPDWPDWLIPPTAPGAKFPIDEEHIEGRLDLVLGYIADHELRRRELRASNTDLRWVELDVSDLAEPDGVAGLFKELGVVPRKRNWRSKARGERRHLSNGGRESISEEEVRAGIASFGARFEAELADLFLDELFPRVTP
jgi:hypothetical protein